MKRAGLLVRIVIAWLLAMQPMLGAYTAAQAANAPFAMELCRGGPAPSADNPAPSGADHADCCLSCAPVSAPPPRGVGIATSAPAPAGRIAARSDQVPVARAGLGPQAARAPPP